MKKINKLFLAATMAVLSAAFVLAIGPFGLNVDGVWKQGPCEVDFDFEVTNNGAQNDFFVGYVTVDRITNETNDTIYFNNVSQNVTANSTVLVDEYTKVDNTAGDFYVGTLVNEVTGANTLAVVYPEDKKRCATQLPI